MADDSLGLNDILNMAGAGAPQQPLNVSQTPAPQQPLNVSQTPAPVPPPPTLTNTPLAPALAGPAGAAALPPVAPTPVAPSAPGAPDAKRSMLDTMTSSATQPTAPASAAPEEQSLALPASTAGDQGTADLESKIATPGNLALGAAADKAEQPKSFLDKLKGASRSFGQGVAGATGMEAFVPGSGATPMQKGAAIMSLLGKIGAVGSAATGSPEQKQQAIERQRNQATQQQAMAQLQANEQYHQGMLGINKQKANTGEEKVGNQNSQAYAKLVAANQNHFLKEAPGSSPDNPSFVPMTADDVIANPGLQGNRDLQQAAILDKQNRASLSAAEADAKNNPDSATQKAVQARLDILRQNANTSHSNLLLNQEKFSEQQRVNAATLGTIGAPGVDASAPLTGDAYLATIPPARANMLKAIAEGRVELSPTMMRGKEGQAIAQQLTNYAPNFDQSRAGSYFNMRKDYTSGQTSKALNSYNTAIAHLSTMRDHVHDSDFVDLNNPTSDTYRRMALDKQLVSTELAKAVSANQMTEKEKGDILNSITSYTTHGYEQKIQEAVSLLKGKLDSYQNQWDNGAPPGAVSQLHMISPQAEHAINHIYSDDPSEPANTKQVKPQVSIQPPNSASTTAGGQTLQAQSGSVSHDQILQGITGPGGAHPIAYADGPQGRLIKMQAGGPWIPLAGNLAAGR